MKKRLVALVMAAAMAAVSVMGCGKLDGSEVVAEVGDAKITADVANFYARYQQARYETYYSSFMGDDMWSGEASEGKTYEESVKESIMETLETLYILEAHAKDYEVAITEEEQTKIDKAVQNFSDGNVLEDKEAVSGESKTVKRVLELLTIEQKMWDAMTADVNTEVADEEAAQKSMQYVQFSFTTTGEDGNAVALSDEEKAALKQTAEEFQQGAVSAEDFAAYAEQAGFEASTATFDSTSTSPSQLLVAAADALGEGEVTGVIEDTTGYYVAKVTSLLDREATDTKKESIVSERKQNAYKELCDEWKEAVDIKVHENVWEKIDFVKQGVTIKDTGKDK